ncbi:hypothetical protein J8N08_20170 [Agrobacterium tumefaciens]|uniref:hypothetical protein n=1 Tax=Agrobacterium tumefaciens TaxID=358 RepID=UPI00055485AF|nr:hypothetical protein [Agrobacterium tumefaciens]KAA3499717.1 hypothetical protein DXM26_22140 [Agrobacterium tumefaciens]NTA83161.1 hypothetical protein [Agrobacterium tumefaciens]NTZ62671.1 hypothetical protein [Agrobacterium tumefaciens]QTQ85247.1 hypothetical protein J8N08_20170 [Agrobacterium tumefaciens]
MSEIRSFIADDLVSVADMFHRFLRKKDGAATDDLTSYLRAVFLENSNINPDIHSKVYVRDDGRVSGFLGVLPVAMELNGRNIQAAVCSSFVAEDRETDPFAGARLLREVLGGPQELTFGETINDVSADMWKTMRGQLLASYSLDWLRILRPASFGLEIAADRFSSTFRALTPFSKIIDRTISARGHGRALSYYASHPDKVDSFTDDDASDTEFARLARELVGHFPLHPVWTEESLLHMLQHAKCKRLHGEPVQRIVRARGGRAVGLFLYHGNPTGIGRTLQIMAVPGQEQIVIDRLIRNAYDRGLAAIRGRTQPALLRAMLGKKCTFLHASSTIVHSRNADLLKAATDGTAFFNGFCGESWTRLIGDSFGQAVE